MIEIEVFYKVPNDFVETATKVNAVVEGFGLEWWYGEIIDRQDDDTLIRLSGFGGKSMPPLILLKERLCEVADIVYVDVKTEGKEIGW